MKCQIHTIDLVKLVFIQVAVAFQTMIDIVPVGNGGKSRARVSCQRMQIHTIAYKEINLKVSNQSKSRCVK